MVRYDLGDGINVILDFQMDTTTCSQSDDTHSGTIEIIDAQIHFCIHEMYVYIKVFWSVKEDFDSNEQVLWAIAQIHK